MIRNAIGNEDYRNQNKRGRGKGQQLETGVAERCAGVVKVHVHGIAIVAENRKGIVKEE